jgi:hypothetical protein
MFHEPYDSKNQNKEDLLTHTTLCVNKPTNNAKEKYYIEILQESFSQLIIGK